MLLQLSDFPSFTPLHPTHPFAPTFPPYSSCPWVIIISSLASTFPILFLPIPHLFSTYHICLFSVPFPPLSPAHSPTDNPPCDLHFCGSVPLLVVCLVCFCFLFFRFSCWWLWVCCHFTVHIFWSSSFSEIYPFNISLIKGLVMMNSFNLTLSGKHFICPSILNDSFAG